MLNFCLQSLFREYGWSFIRHVVVPHPLKTAKAVLRSSRRDFSGDMMATSDEDPGQTLGGPRSIVGVGVCLKPMDPPCLSGRSNHDCQYLEHLLPAGTREIPECCRQCAIRKIGLAALKTGAAFYVMTSAKDILHELFLPGLKENRFTSGVFVLCRYSLRPFAVGLLAAGIHGWLLPFEQGDCRDYKTWLLADRGIKDERTSISTQNQGIISELLADVTKEPDLIGKYKREGNILYLE